MNILKRELKVNLKPFLFWSLGLFVLIFAGMAKFTGLREGGEAVAQMLAAFPRAVQAMFGMVGVDMTTLPGYYAVVMYYVMICMAVCGVSLGSAAVARETADKTYEFLFTKPVSRARILAIKLSAGLCCLAGFALLSAGISYLSIGAFHLEKGISGKIALFATAAFLVGLFFYFLAAMLAALQQRAEKGALMGNLIFTALFLLGMVYDLLEDAEELRWFIPLRYFTMPELLENHLQPVYTCLTIGLAALFAAIAFYGFMKKDLQAKS